tara:strand:+ start:3636 stop:4472 length:837 start_codon:yes stop_codon:yes gene_type:complete
MNDPSVTIIVLNWNGKDLTLECLDSLYKVNYSNYNILVVDNKSSDGSVESFHKQYPNISVLELDKNYGYAEGNNRGFIYLNNDKPDYVIFLNNDTIVDKDFINPLISPLISNKNIHQTAPKIYYQNNKELIWYAGGNVNLWTGGVSHRGIRQYDKDKFNIEGRTEYATGCCFSMRYEDFKEIGGFDQNFPMYSEDVDLSLSIRKKNYVVWYAPDSIIWHKVSASIGGSFSFSKNKRKLVGLFLLFRKHANPLQYISITFLVPFQLIFQLIRLIFKIKI